MTKRYGRPRLKEGELRVQYGKLPRENPDVIFNWKGPTTMKRDSAFLYWVLGSARALINGTFDKSVIEELELRGYDITTLKFSIMKKEL